MVFARGQVMKHLFFLQTTVVLEVCLVCDCEWFSIYNEDSALFEF